MADNTLISDTVSARRKGTILIVDDEDGPRQALEVVFRGDYQVLLAKDGPTAIELARTNRVDVAISDIRMAGMSGIEVLERLKFVDPAIEVIMMTAYETTETMRKALRLRACDYLNKPFDLAAMRQAVAEAMQRRTLDNEITSNHEKLQELLAELNNYKLEKQMAETRSDIYASIIHDINGPLSVISGYVQMINQRIGNAEQLNGEEVQFIKDRLKTMTRQVTNCIEISRRYLSYLRKQPGEGGRSPVNQVLTDLGQLLRVHPSRLDHQLDVLPLATDVTAKINATDLIQVLSNLAVNAFQAEKHPHRVLITGEVLHTPLELTNFKDTTETRIFGMETFDNTAPLVKLSVTDDGPGIPSEILPRIFQAYFTTKDARQGTGLGLNIVQRSIQTHNGALHVRTRIGEGTTFTVYLPAAEATK